MNGDIVIGEFGYRVAPVLRPVTNWHAWLATVFRIGGSTIHTRYFDTEDAGEWWARMRIAELGGGPFPEPSR